LKPRSEDIKQTRVLLAIGGLMHDLGKVILRSMDEKEKKELFPQLGKEEKYKDTFSYAHAYSLWEFIRKHSGRLELKTNPLDKPIILTSSFHHKPEGVERFEELRDYQLFAYIYQKADRLSSSERSKKERKIETPFLRSIFQDIKFQEEKEFQDTKDEEKEFLYMLEPLSMDEEIIFPKSVEKKEPLSNEFENPVKQYKEHWEKFLIEFKNILKNFVSYEKLLLHLYHLFYRYFWCVPASTFDPEREERHYPDISLFDHLRTASALATSFYTEYNLEKLKNGKENELKLIFIRGDLTGIQKYLYHLKNIEKVTKRLRGKSFFLGMLPEVVARALLNKFNYPFTNIIFSGGGNFEVVIGYEEDISEKLKEFSEEIENTLFKKFGGVLGLTLGCAEISYSEFKDHGYKAISEKLERSLSIKKKTKFCYLLDKNNLDSLIKLLNSELEDLAGKTFVRCRSCHQNFVEEIAEEEKVCEVCETFEKIGKELIEAKYLVFSFKEISLPGIFLENIGGIYLVEDLKGIDRKECEIYCFNDTDFVSSKADGFKFVANVVPIEEKDVMPFENLVEFAQGDKKLAFARADVDNLGLIFMMGLGEDYSLSRVATLSRSLDLFFSGYLNKLFTQKNSNDKKKDFYNKIYTVYAGGDDLFIVGPWDVIFYVMEAINEKFKCYTCENENFDISCGIFIGRDSYPLRFAAERAKKAEDEAKREKSAISALEETLKWDEFKEALSKGDEIAKILEERNIGRSLFYKFYLLIRNYKKLEKKEREEERNYPEKYKFYPLFYYYLYRNIKDEGLQSKIKDFLLDIRDDYKVRKDALFRAKYVIMKTRT